MSLLQSAASETIFIHSIMNMSKNVLLPFGTGQQRYHLMVWFNYLDPVFHRTEFEGQQTCDEDIIKPVQAGGVGSVVQGYDDVGCHDVGIA